MSRRLPTVVLVCAALGGLASAPRLASAATLRASANNMFVAAENAGAGNLIANRGAASTWEEFQLQNNSDGTVSIIASINGRFVTVDAANGNRLIANRTTVTNAERFRQIAQSNGTVAFQSVANGLFVAADLNLGGVLVANRGAASTWEQFTVSGGSAPPPPPPPPPPGGGTLIWSDEFNGPNNSQPNSSNWSFLTGNGFDGAGFTGWGNGEWEWYRPENCFIRDGRLILRAEWLAAPMVIAGRQWFQRSCRITTRGKRSWQYGAIEASIAMPSRIGTWPAFWMMGDSSDGTLTTAYNPPFDYFDRMGTRWPSSGEIDIMEHVNTLAQTTHNLFWHTGVGIQPWCASCVANAPSNAPVNNVTAFHVYRLEWTSTQLRWLIDGVVVKTQSTSPATMEEFRQPFHLILNLALAGAFPGVPPNQADFPMEMQVEYVRVFAP